MCTFLAFSLSFSDCCSRDLSRFLPSDASFFLPFPEFSDVKSSKQNSLIWNISVSFPMEGKEKEKGNFFEEEEALTSLAFWDDGLEDSEDNKAAERNERAREPDSEESDNKEIEEGREGGRGDGEGEGGEWKAMVDFLCSSGIPLSAADLYAFRLFRCHVTTPVLSLFHSVCLYDCVSGEMIRLIDVLLSVGDVFRTN